MNRPATGPPSWSGLLRALRKAAGVTQEGWAARLGYGRRTVQRWERGELPPDSVAAEALVRLCAELRLYRTHSRGELTGLTVTGDLIRQLLHDARLEVGNGASAAPGPTHNLPLELSSFVGREPDLARLASLLESGRLLTVTGAGGIGKSRLALRAAARLLDEFADGVWLVELDGLAEAAMVPHLVADIVGAREQPGQALAETLVASLRTRHLLLVLDGCDQLLGACASLAARLLAACPRLHILATSREPLGVSGEAVWRLEPLGLPGNVTDTDWKNVAHAESVRLFEDRGRLVRDGFAVTADNASAIAEICRRLDGIPLAVELAAAQVRVLSPSHIVERLQGGILPPSGANRAGPARHYSLEASIGSSYQLLDSSERRVFENVAVFGGGFSLEAAEVVCADAGVLAILTRLVDKSLVLARPDDEEQAMRYHVLEPLRAYAAERLEQRRDFDKVRRRQADWLLSEAERLPSAIHGPEQRRWLRWVDRERQNIVAAASWSLRRGEPETALSLGAALYWPLAILGRIGETRIWLEPALEVAGDDVPAGVRVEAQLGAATHAIFQGDRATASKYIERAEPLAHELGDAHLIALARGARALLLQVSGRFDETAEEAKDWLPELRRLGETFLEARALEMMATRELARGDFEAAALLFEESGRLARQTDDTYGLALALAGLGDVARSRGEAARARVHYSESVALRESLGLSATTASLRHNLAYVALAEGDATAAGEHFTAALVEFQRQGNERSVAECVIGQAAVAARAGDADLAVRLFGAGEALLERSGSRLWPSNRADYDRYLALIRDALMASDFDARWAEGKQMETDQAIAMALATARRLNPGAGG